MDKRQLRQSAVADFLQSLEHLDELLGDTTDTLVLDDGPQEPESGQDESRSSQPHQPRNIQKNHARQDPPNSHQP
ncbi:hypothetical protein D0962_17145 [Leptolyngbyaceae cyanobacterium CCMR0082]|uniref:Uncharacterized protein n=2 Tax=Adonisia turfae TaxID=2950184 RepID=A0A6M0S9S4_9CYAN|nr:hypothetical protein [Adonisia turfae]NEZ56605.1 hypothetical protein [Adonisia turfae CCMR0081]NEZ64492.1 hypothetical protein [Adonisia turfae CCMR0082]